MSKSIALFTICLIIFFQNLYAKEKPINILIVNSYHHTLPWSRQLFDGIIKFQQNFDGNVEFYMEAMDNLRLNKDIEAVKWEEHFIQKYENVEFDGIIVASAYAVNFFKNLKHEKFKNIPTVYYPNDEEIDTKFVQSIYDMGPILLEKNLEMAKNHNKDLENIFIIEADNPGGKRLEEILLTQLKNSSYNVQIIEELAIGKLQEQLATIPANSAVFYFMRFKDEKGTKYTPKEFLSKIAPFSNAPIYGFWSPLLGSGLVGGYMIDGEMLIQKILDFLIIRIKEGNFPQKPNSIESMIDYNIMKKYNIDSSTNPKDTIIINRPIPIWESYPIETALGSIIILLFLLLIILGLFLKIRDKKIHIMEQTMLLQSKQASMGEMINIIAHQWKQPLQIVSVMIQTIYLKYNRKSLNQDFIEMFKNDMEKQITYMSTLIDDFQNFNTPDREKINFSLVDVIEKVVSLVKNSYQNDYSITITQDIKNDFYIKGYPNELVHCFLIILSNAKDALCENLEQHDKKINITLKFEDDIYILSFENNGKHIPTHHIKNIFNQYFSTKKDKGGVGIGLYVVKKILTNHFDCNIDATNTPFGVKFDIKFKK